MPASPRRRACCNRHEARGGIVALVSCCLVRLSNGGLGPPDETAVVPLWRAASTRRLSEVPSAALATHCFSLCSTERPEPVKFFWRPRASETTAKDIISARIGFRARAAILPLLDWLPERVARDFFAENSGAFGDDSSLFAATQQQWRGLYVARSPAHCHPPHLTPDWLQERSRLRRMKVVTDSLVTDAR